MKIMILAAAALVATTLSAAAAHVDNEHDGGVVGNPGETQKMALTEGYNSNLEQGEAGVVESGASGQPVTGSGCSVFCDGARMPFVPEIGS
jgi:hypothetical protein